MDMKGEVKEVVQQTHGATNSYVAAGHGEYSRNRVYTTQNGEYITDKYSEYSGKSHEDYVQNENVPVSSNQGTLYSVSQRVPPANAAFSNMCPAEGSYASEQVPYPSHSGDWERTAEVVPESNAEMINDKQKNESSSAAANNGMAANTSASYSSSNEPLQGVIPTCIYLYSRTAILMDIEDTPTATSDLMCQAIVQSEELGLNRQTASQVFALWMCSPLLELQMKPSHKPYEIRKKWRSLVEQYSHDSYNWKERDEPTLLFKRNVFYPQYLEEKIKDQRILELLYEEARHNILESRYPCEVAHYIMLGGIQAGIELGAYNPQIHSTHYFREEQAKYLPMHVRKSATWTWLPISSKNSAEVRLLEQFKRIPISATNRKLMRKYLEFCWSLPFYGSAFFEGQIEQPVRGLTSLMTHQDIPVLLGINCRGVYVIDDIHCTLLLGLRYEDLSWDYARPSKEGDPDCLPCLFLQFMVVENGARVSKILQVFSRQASLMDTLIAGFVNRIKNKTGDELDRNYDHGGEADADATHAAINSSHNLASLPSLSNKLSKLTLATFDEDGRCIGQMGSWSFSF